MAIEYWYPNGNDGGWVVSTHGNCDEGLNPGPGLDNDSSGPDDGTFITCDDQSGDVLILDTGPAGASTAIGDADTVTQVRIFVRATLNASGPANNIQVALLIGGTSQNAGSPETGHLTGSFVTYTLSDSGWDSDWTAAQLAGMQVQLTSEQGGMPDAYDVDVSEVEVEVTYTAGATINTVTLSDAITNALMVDDVDLLQRFRVDDVDLLQRFRNRTDPDESLTGALMADDVDIVQRYRARVLDFYLDNISDSVIESYVPGSGVINVVTLSDAITNALLLDSNLTQRFRNRQLEFYLDSIADSVFMQRIRTRVLDFYLDNIADSVIESYVPASVINEVTLSDAITIDDSDVYRIRVKIAHDEIVITDSVIETYVPDAGGGPTINTVTLTDSITNALLVDDTDLIQRFRSRLLDDSAEITDDEIMLRLRSRLLDDSAEITDDEIISRLRSRLLQSLIDNITDSTAEQRYRNRVEQSETTVTDELFNVLRIRQRVLADLIEVADSVIEARTGTTVKTLTDAIDLADGTLALRLRERYLDADTVDMTDQISIVATRMRIGTDLIEVTDSIEALQRFRSRSLSSSIELTDDSVSLRLRFRILTDEETVTDSVLEVYVPDDSGGIVVRNLTDTILLSDEVLTLRLRERLQTELLELTDGTVISRFRNRLPNADNVTITDFIDDFVARNVRLGDTITLTDDGDLLLRLRQRSFDDTIDIGDSNIPLRLRNRILDTLVDITDGAIPIYAPFEVVSVRIKLLDDQLWIIIGDDDEIAVPTNMLSDESSFESWSPSLGSSASDNADTAPDGAQTAGTITDSHVGLSAYVAQSITVATNKWYEVSVYVKKTTGLSSKTFGMDVLQTGGPSPKNYFSRLNTDTGEVLDISFNGNPLKADDVYDYWKLVRVFKTGIAGGTDLEIRLKSATNEYDILASDSNSSLGSATIWKAQVHLPYDVVPIIDSFVGDFIKTGDNS